MPERASTESAIDPVRLARDLVRCPSVTPADAGAIPTLARALEVAGFACELLRFQSPGEAEILNLWATVGSDRGRHFCFAGHTDVVPPGDPARWRVDPFGGSVEDGLLIGRGAADMKSAVAAFAAAADRFLRSRPGFDGRISLMIAGDEEGRGVDGTRAILDGIEARGIEIDACLVGEPTSAARLGDTIKIGRRGSLNGTLTVAGIAGHTAYPQLADNPAHRIVAMLAALLAEPLDAGTAHFEPSSLQISTVDIGNPATNVIPAEARAGFNIRFNDLWNAASIETWLRRLLDRTGGAYRLDIACSGEAFLTPPGAFATLVAESVHRVTGVRPAFSTGGGTSDARFIHRHCPVAEFGLVGKTMHKYDEAVPVAEIETLAQIYQAVLVRFFDWG